MSLCVYYSINQECLDPLIHVCAGRTWQEKVSDVRAKMKESLASVVVVTALDEVACMLKLLT